MKHTDFSPVALFGAVAGCLFLSGCVTRTRMGDALVPAHPLSACREGREVRLYIVHEKTPAYGPAETAALAFAVEEGLGFLAYEISKEAERYLAQYGSAVRFTTADIRNGGYIVLLRGERLPEALRADQLESGDCASVVKRIESGDRSPRLSSMVVLKLVGSQVKNLWAVVPQWIWLKRSRAKVVGLSPWPWHWPGDVLLQTGNEVNISLQVQFEGLVMRPGGGHSAVTRPPLLSMMLPEIPLELTEEGSAFAWSDQAGDWLYVPLMGNSAEKTGFVTVRLNVTEADPSNVSKRLTQRAERMRGQAEGTDWKEILEELLGTRSD